MNVHEQFAEDLALYAMGSLEGAERQVLKQHLEGCGSCRQELERLRGDLGMLALTASGPKQPARSRQRLMSAIASEPRDRAALASPSSPSSSLGRRRSWMPILGWAAAAALALVCIGLLRQNSTLQRDAALTRSQFDTQFNDQEAKLAKANAVVATLLDPEATKIELIATGNKPQPRGKAIYQRRTHNLIFLASNLPPLPAEKIYELWLFPANGGSPIAAGLFKPDAHGSATLVNPPLPEGVVAKTFAVTLEPRSGSHESPRGTPVIAGAGE